MSWTFEFTDRAQKELRKLDPKAQRRIKDTVYTKLVINPDYHLIALRGNKAGLYKFRVGDYRPLCSKNDEKLCVLVVKVRHRREAYS